jgi:mono/diheme cytochrome c family protein
MFLNIFVVLLIGLVALFLGWLAWRAWHARRGWLKWIGGLLSSLATLLVVLLLGVILWGFYRMNVPPYRYSDTGVQVDMTPEQLALGARYANGCADCHSTTGSPPLDGSKDNFLEGGPPMGVLYAPNLTPGGKLKDWTDADIIRAIREGVDKDGKPLFIMPSQAFHAMSDADVAAIVAYLRSQPAVDRPVPERNLTVLAAVLIGAGMAPASPQPPITDPVVAPPMGTADYGEYITRVMGCHDCHGPNLGGGVPGMGPVGPNLTMIVPTWTEEDLFNLFRQGVGPGGAAISDEMPWKTYNKIFTDDQLKDIYSYLHALQPIASVQP